MTRLGPLLAACVAALLVVTACGPDDDPRPNYSSVSATPSASSTSASPTASPSPTVPTTGPNVGPGEVAPTQPALATSGDQTGALTFVGFYVRMSDWVFATSDTTILDPFFAPDCSTCKSGQDFLSNLVLDGAHFEGGRISVDRIEVVANDGRQGADFAITSVTNVEAARVVGPDGRELKTFPASTGFQLTDWVKYSGGRWVIVEERKV